MVDSRLIPLELYTILDPSSKNVFYSMDVVSLFDRIPLPALRSVISKLGVIIPNGIVDMGCLLELVDMDLYKLNLFRFQPNGLSNGKSLFYEQVDGIPMGGKTSSIYADIYLSYNLSLLGNLHVKYGISYIRKYADDFLVYGPISSITRFVEDYSAVTQLEFTIEHADIHGKLPFLDMCITLWKGVLTTRWYWKPITSSRCVNFHSKAPRRELISTYVQRIATASIYDSGGSILYSYHRILNEMYHNSLPRAIMLKILRIVSGKDLGRNSSAKVLLLSYLCRHLFSLRLGVSYVEFISVLRIKSDFDWVLSNQKDVIHIVRSGEYNTINTIGRGSKNRFGGGDPLVTIPYHGGRSERLHKMLNVEAGIRGLVYRRDRHYTSRNMWNRALVPVKCERK